MPHKDPDVAKEYFREYYKKNKEHKLEYKREWTKNNIGYMKKYHENNKEREEEYRQTERSKMMMKINRLISQGVIYYDMEELYYTWKMTTHCHYCNVELVEGNYGSSKKCLDHDHETGEPRGVICQTCNIKDVFKNC